MYGQSGQLYQLLIGIFWLNVALADLFIHEKRFNRLFIVLGVLSALIFDLILINCLYFYPHMIVPYLIFIIAAIALTIEWVIIIIEKINGRKIIIWKTGNKEDSDSQQ